MLSSPIQQKLSRILKVKFCTKKTFVTSINDNGPMVEILDHRNSFTSKATNLFNEQITKNISQLNKENTSTSETKKYFYDRALARFT